MKARQKLVKIAFYTSGIRKGIERFITYGPSPKTKTLLESGKELKDEDAYEKFKGEGRYLESGKELKVSSYAVTESPELTVWNPERN